jgi:hypothetical protein
MNFVQSICIVVAGLLIGIALWLVIAGVLFLLMQGFEIGFVSIIPDIGEYIKNGIIVGTGHGLLIALAVLFSRDRSSFISNISTGLLITEVGILLTQFYLFSYAFEGWKSTTVQNSIKSAIIWFLIFSGFFLIPTILLAIALTKVAGLSVLTKK